jgi:hypothetical protein
VRRLWCDGPTCWSHPDGREHHAAPCPEADTLHARGHLLDHALTNLLEALELELRGTLAGPWQLLKIRIRAAAHRARRTLAR